MPKTMNRRRFFVPLALLLLPSLFALAPRSSAAQEEVKPVAGPIFNGRDLTGWDVPKENLWWRVEDGVLIGENDPKKKGSELFTKAKYRDFVLEGEFRYNGEVDSGFFLRTKNHQVQIGVSRSLKTDMTGSVYISGKGYPGRAQGVDKLLKVGEWNRMRVEVRGKEYKVWLNGQPVLTYTAETAPEEGPVGVQVHGGLAMRIDFRNLKVTPLEKPT
jgi:hypothetical protein